MADYKQAFVRIDMAKPRDAVAIADAGREEEDRGAADPSARRNTDCSHGNNSSSASAGVFQPIVLSRSGSRDAATAAI